VTQSLPPIITHHRAGKDPSARKFPKIFSKQITGIFAATLHDQLRDQIKPSMLQKIAKGFFYQRKALSF
jgi:hypothetical protein